MVMVQNVPREQWQAEPFIAPRDFIRQDAGILIRGFVLGETQPRMRLQTDRLEFGPGGSTAPDTVLRRTAADTLILPGTIGIGTTSPADPLHIVTESALIRLETNGATPRIWRIGTIGSDGFFYIRDQTAGLNRWIVNLSGAFIAFTDNSIDIGASGANRPRDVYIARDLTVAGSVALGAGALATGATTGFPQITTTAGAPTGAVAAIVTGLVPINYDSTNNRIYVRNTVEGTPTWRSVAVAGFQLPRYSDVPVDLKNPNGTYNETICPLCQVQMRPLEGFGLIGSHFYEDGGLHSFGAHLDCILGQGTGGPQGHRWLKKRLKEALDDREFRDWLRGELALAEV